MYSAIPFLCLIGAATATCPYGFGDVGSSKRSIEDHQNLARDADTDFLDQFTLDDTDAFLTSDAGGPISDQTSLKAGERGSTLLEDFIFRQKIQHFDHERVSLIS
jgi:catalase